MKLSMWILAKELEEYSPRCMIQNGEMVLRTARPLSSGQKPSLDTLYIGQASDDRTVICVNGHDILLLENNDPEQILSDIMDIFDRYNSWSEEMKLLSSQRGDARALMKLANSKLDGLLSLCDISFQVLAAGTDSGAMPDTSILMDSTHNNLFRVDIARKVGADPRLWANTKNAYPHATPGLNVHGALKNLFLDDRQVGWLAFTKDDPEVTKAELDIMDEISEAAKSWYRLNILNSAYVSSNMIYLDILNGSDDRERLRQRLLMSGYREEGCFRIYYLRPFYANAVKPDVLLKKLSVLFEKHMVSEVKNGLFLLSTDGSDPETLLKQLLIDSGWCAGHSCCFNNIFSMKEMLDLAEKVSDLASDAGLINMTASTAMTLATEKLKELGPCFSHSALETLRDHDRKNSTELYPTLEAFLICERNLVRTASMLHVHRNTVVYRMERVEELLGLDLESETLRMYLRLSFMMNKGNKYHGKE